MFDPIILVVGLLIVLVPRLIFPSERNSNETHHWWLIRGP